MVAIGGALCKLFFDCGLHNGARYDEGHLKSLAAPGLRTKLPAGFTEGVVAGGLTFPTDFAFLPDGRLLVAEKHGIVRIFENGRALTRPFVDLSSRVDTDGYRGLLAVQVDPEFVTNHYVYLLYVRKSTGSAGAPTTVRLARVTAAGDFARPGSEQTLLGAAGKGSCLDLPRGSDCIPSDRDHDGGDVVFAQDGTLFVSTGDGGGRDDLIEPTALGAQDVDYLGGKILHITREGKGVSSNPFWNGDEDANRSKVWAYGLRNPFRFTLRPGSGVPYVGDVGAGMWEEIDVATRGANLGWPCYEGRTRYWRYGRTSECRALYAKGPAAIRMPALAYRHGTPTGGQSVTGGVFYTGTNAPERYRGGYVYGDWEVGWLRILRFDRTGRVVGSPERFATDAQGPVSIQNGPDGALYFLAINASELRRIANSA